MKITLLTVVFSGTFMISGNISAEWTWEKINPQPSWKDSYSFDGKCYIDSQLDHGVAEKRYQGYTVAELAKMLPRGPGPVGNPIYNDVQCGNGPANEAGDELLCPGRVDMGKQGCRIIGPKWDLSALDDTSSKNTTTTGPECITVAQNIFGARKKFELLCKKSDISRCARRSDGRIACYSAQ